MKPPAGRSRSDAGMTLIEVLVGVVIFTVIGGLLTAFVVEMLRSNTGTTNRATNVDQLRVSTDAVTRGLRTAVRPEQLNSACASACDAAFLTASPSAVTFYANHGTAGKARLTTYRVEQDPNRTGTGRLVEELRASAAPGGAPSTACGAGCTSRTLARGLAWPVSVAEPVFSFADAGCATFVTAMNTADIACVLVDLAVLGARDNPGTSATSTVFLPNSVMGR